MLQKHPILAFIAIFILTSLACNAFAGGGGDEPPALELPPPAVTLVGTAVADDGLAPTATLPGDPPIETTAPAPGTATVNILVDLNIRSGPGVAFDRLGFFTKGATIPLLGQEAETGWWLVQCPPHIDAPQCWVSGGSQYTTPANDDGVPEVPSPPTPTPAPTDTPAPIAESQVAIGAGIVVYADNSGLWILPLGLEGTLPAAGAPVQIVADPNIQQLIVAPDGQRIAYVSGGFEQNGLYVVGIDGNGRSELISSEGLSLPDEPADTAVLVDQIAWLPDSRSIAFNTTSQNLVGPGTFSQQDLWIASVNGEVTERFSAGNGGQTFAISPNGQQVIFGRPEAVVRANLDGANIETVVEFEFVNTASEYAYAPTAQWLPDNSAALIAISDPDPWQPTAKATLYRIPGSGTAAQQGSILGNTLFTSVNWTASGNNLIYVQTVLNGSSEQALTLAQGNGQNPQAYRVGEQLNLFAWSPNFTNFLYSGNGFYGVGQPGAAPVEIAIPVGVSTMRWLNDSNFVSLIGSNGSWDLVGANLAGETAELININKDVVPMDVWIP